MAKHEHVHAATEPQYVAEPANDLREAAALGRRIATSYKGHAVVLEFARGDHEVGVDVKVSLDGEPSHRTLLTYWNAHETKLATAITVGPGRHRHQEQIPAAVLSLPWFIRRECAWAVGMRPRPAQAASEPEVPGEVRVTNTYLTLLRLAKAGKEFRHGDFEIDFAMRGSQAIVNLYRYYNGKLHGLGYYNVYTIAVTHGPNTGMELRLAPETYQDVSGKLPFIVFRQTPDAPDGFVRQVITHDIGLPGLLRVLFQAMQGLSVPKHAAHDLPAAKAAVEPVAGDRAAEWVDMLHLLQRRHMTLSAQPNVPELELMGAHGVGMTAPDDWFIIFGEPKPGGLHGRVFYQSQNGNGKIQVQLYTTAIPEHKHTETLTVDLQTNIMHTVVAAIRQIMREHKERVQADAEPEAEYTFREFASLMVFGQKQVSLDDILAKKVKVHQPVSGYPVRIRTQAGVITKMGISAGQGGSEANVSLRIEEPDGDIHGVIFRSSSLWPHSVSISLSYAGGRLGKESAENARPRHLREWKLWLAQKAVEKCRITKAEAAAEPYNDPREYLCDKLRIVHRIILEPSQITYIGKDGIDYDGSVHAEDKNLHKIPVRFRNITGNFYCHDNHITSLENAPRHVGRDFYCSYNNLTTLKHAPTHVGGDLSCAGNRFTSLEHAPGYVGGGFYCRDNRLPLDTKKPAGVKGEFVLGPQEPVGVHGAVEPVQSKLRDIDYVARMFENDFGPGLLDAPEPWRVHPISFGKSFAIDVTNKETQQRLLFEHISEHEGMPHAKFQVWANRRGDSVTHFIDNEHWRGHAVKIRVINVPNQHSNRKAYQTLVALAHIFLKLTPKLLEQELASLGSVS